jgi:multiple sugar transport system permease protein
MAITERSARLSSAPESPGLKSKAAAPLWRRGVLDPKRATDHILLLPAVLVLLAVYAFPIGYSFYLSTRSVNLVQSADVHPFIGLTNYLSAVSDNLLASSIGVTAAFAGGTVALTILFGLGIALILNDESIRGYKLYRSFLLIPWAVSPVANGLLWTWIYQGRYGVLNAILVRFGITEEYINFFIRGDTAMACLVFAEVWKAVPFCSLILLAALQGVRRDLYEAAEIDGAGSWGKLMNVTIPSIRNVLLVVLVLLTMWEMQAFAIMYVLTQGGPGVSTTTANLYIYKVGFKQLQLGYSAALAHLLTVVIFICTVVYIRVIGQQEAE